MVVGDNTMTLQELMDIAPDCDLIEVVVRKDGHGQWVQGYRVGKDAKIYPSEITAEIRELKGLKEYRETLHDVRLSAGEVVKFNKAYSNSCPMTVICKDCHKLPTEIGKLEVCMMLPRHVPSFHKEQLTHNDFALDIWCYPPEHIPQVEVKEVKQETEQLEGQLSIFDLEG